VIKGLVSVDLTARGRELAAPFAAFLRERINPGTVERDATASPFPIDVFRELAALGLVGFALPREHGGGGHDALEWGLVLEQVGYLCDDNSLPLLLGLQVSVCKTLLRSGNREIIDEWVRPMVEGRCLGSLAYTDVGDSFDFKTVARREAGDWVLDGFKPIVTGGRLSQLFLTYVRHGDDLMATLVTRDDPGVELTPIQPMGYRAAGLASLRLRNVPLPDGRVLAASDGLSAGQAFLNERRALIVCGPLGRIQALYEQLVDDIDASVRYGRSVSELGNVQAQLGRLGVAIESARALCHSALEHMTTERFDPYFDPLVSAAKHAVTECALEVAMAALRMGGGTAYLAVRPYERHVRDFCGMLAGAGTQDVLEVNLGTHAVTESRHRQLRNSRAGGSADRRQR
jgi:alkylation response protein AidB-like acyl-CoA dehydrogenase